MLAQPLDARAGERARLPRRAAPHPGRDPPGRAGDPPAPGARSRWSASPRRSSVPTTGSPRRCRSSSRRRMPSPGCSARPSAPLPAPSPVGSAPAGRSGTPGHDPAIDRRAAQWHSRACVHAAGSRTRPPRSRSARAHPPRHRVEVPPAGGHRVLRGGPGRPGDRAPGWTSSCPSPTRPLRRRRRRPRRRGARPARARPGARLPPAAAATDRPCLVWLHGGAFSAATWTCPRPTGPPGRSATAPAPSSSASTTGCAIDGVHLPGAARRRRRRRPLGARQRRRPRHRRRPDLARRRQRRRQPRRRRRAAAARRRRLAAGRAAARLHDVPTPSSRRRRPRWPRCWPRSRRLLRFLPEDRDGITDELPGRPASRGRRLRHAGATPCSRGCCPVLLLNAEYDDLRASGEAFAGQLRASPASTSARSPCPACCTASSTCTPASSRSTGRWR